jgi:hypothetical protein
MEESFLMRPRERPEIPALNEDFREYRLAGQDIPRMIDLYTTLQKKITTLCRVSA